VTEAERTVLRGITWDHPRGLASVRGAAAAYERSHPDVHIEWQARSLQGFADQPLEALVRDHDLLVIDHPHIPAAAVRGLLLPLDDLGYDHELAGLARGSVGSSHRSYRHLGHQYALAIDAAAQVAVYRPDLLPVPPRTWPEVLELATGGRVLWPARPIDAISSFLTLAVNRGAAIGVDGFIETEVGLEVMALLGQLAALVDRTCLDQDPIQVAERLADSDDWSYAPLLFGYTNYSRAGFRRHRLAYIDMPIGPGGLRGSCLGGAGIAVSARTPHPQLAVEHAFWLASAEIQRGVYYTAGGQPAHAAAWEDEHLDADALGFFSSTRRTLDGAWLRPRFDGWLQIQDGVGTLIDRALRGELSAAACLAAADDLTVHVLEEANAT
jgi:multiple sugar transport system substrate-binding protein